MFGGSIYRKMIKVQKKKMGVAVLAAAAMLAAMVTVAAAGGVPLTDKDLESEESMWNLYAYIYERGGRLNVLLVNGDVAG